MERLAATQADRLALYHLAEAFGVSDASRAALSEEAGALSVTLERQERRASEREEIDPAEGLRGRQIALGLAFARAALRLEGETPPYGTLIGVRPVKAALRLLREGTDRETGLAVLRERYLVLPEKANLLWDLAEIERREERPGDVMLYVSIPFCPSRCRYCSFISSSAPRHLALIPDYLALLEKDLALAGEALREAGKKASAVYVGGGTPGILSAPQLQDLLRAIRAFVPLETDAEITVEIGRPDTVTREKLAVLADAGVGRVCVNPQTTRDDVLEKIGRSHRNADFLRAVKEVRAFPFTVNCDLIAGLPGDDAAGFLSSVKEVLALSPENLTVHALCLKRSASERGESRGFPGIREAVAEAHGLCIENGLFPYYLYRQKMAAAGLENLGFARAGTLCRYNLCMMEDLSSVAACGAGAIGKVVPGNGGRIRRFPQPKYPFEYLAEPERLPGLHRAFREALEERA